VKCKNYDDIQEIVFNYGDNKYITNIKQIKFLNCINKMGFFIENKEEPKDPKYVELPLWCLIKIEKYMNFEITYGDKNKDFLPSIYIDLIDDVAITKEPALIDNSVMHTLIPDGNNNVKIYFDFEQENLKYILWKYKKNNKYVNNISATFAADDGNDMFCFREPFYFYIVSKYTHDIEMNDDDLYYYNYEYVSNIKFSTKYLTLKNKGEFDSVEIVLVYETQNIYKSSNINIDVNLTKYVI
jgi:hypothetical protein